MIGYWLEADGFPIKASGITGNVLLLCFSDMKASLLLCVRRAVKTAAC